MILKSDRMWRRQREGGSGGDKNRREGFVGLFPGPVIPKGKKKKEEVSS